MAKSKSAKRRNARSRTAQKHADKRAHRSQKVSHQSLPKVGTKPDSAYLARRRREDIVDFGLGSHGRSGRRVGLAVAALAVVLLLVFLILLVL